jgi:protein ImuA
MMKELTGKKEIISHLKEKILVLEGFSSGTGNRQPDFGLGPVNAAFPGGVFPVGAVHEFVSPTEVGAAAANGFLSFLLGTLMKTGGVCLWISAGRKLFPSSLKFFGVEPHRVIFVDVARDRDVLWVMEQGLKCRALAAVVAELRDVSFPESRRLQLAAGTGGVTGFLHRQHLYTENTLACVSRWKIRPLPGRTDDGLPGVGFPRIEVELAKIRNGRPGIWQFEWQDGVFLHVPVQRPAVPMPGLPKKERRYA